MNVDRGRASHSSSEGSLPHDAAELITRWQPALEPFLARLGRAEQCEHATRYLVGLLSPLPQKTTEPIAYFFNQSRHGLQHFVGASSWDWSGLIEELVHQVDKTLAEPNGIAGLNLVAIPKKGNASVGVDLQSVDPAGELENCQVALYLGYVSRKGVAIVDTRLYLPPSWTRDLERRQRCGVPPRLSYRRHGQLAVELLEHLDKRLPHVWVVANAALGGLGEFRQALRGHGTNYLVAVPSSTPARTEEGPRTFATVAQLGASASKEAAWSPSQAGPRVPEVTEIPVITRGTRRAQQKETLIGLPPTEPSVSPTECFLSNVVGPVPSEEWHRAIAAIRRITDYVQRARKETGLTTYEVRTWAGWHHHQTLALVASWLHQHP